MSSQLFFREKGRFWLYNADKGADSNTADGIRLLNVKADEKMRLVVLLTVVNYLYR